VKKTGAFVKKNKHLVKSWFFVFYLLLFLSYSFLYIKPYKTMRKLVFATMFVLFSTLAFAQNTFRFTNNPSNDACEMKGESVKVDGKLYAQRAISQGGKEMYFAHPSDGEVILTVLTLNSAGEVRMLDIHYITSEYIEDLVFEPWDDKKNSFLLSNFYTKYDCQSWSEFEAGMEEKSLNGVFVGNFASAKDIETFKQVFKKK